MKPSSQVRSPVDPVREEPRRPARKCPGCGQHLDRATRRCPRCLLWLLPLPAPPRRGPLAMAAGAGALLLVGALLGIVLYAYFSNVPHDVVVHDEHMTAGDTD